jgi:acyl-coenzyme A synthetase/AMP-(fatty) acid ligase
MSELVAQLRVHAANQPSKTALIVLGVGGAAQEISYAQLSHRVNQFASCFCKQMDSPQIVPLIAAKDADAVAAMFGLLASGNAFAALNRKLKPPQIDAIVRLTRPVMSVEKLEVDRATEDLWIEPRAADSVGCCLFTSGSTGTPKGVLISAQDLHARAVAEVNCFRLTSDDVLLSVLPFSFDVGLNQLTSGVVAGCTIVLSESWLPADILRATQRFGVTGISAVPAIWNDLLSSGLQFRSLTLRYVTVSGGDLPVDRLKQLKSAVGDAGIIKTYGQSETFRSAALLPEEFAQKPASVGRVFVGASVYIVRPDGSLAAPNEAGEIVHSGLGTMLGYLGGESPNFRANHFHGPADSAGRAVFTGDLGWLDEEGFLFVQGRRDSMLKIAGNRVYPQEIVNQLLLLPGVASAEIVADKDASGETQITAFLVPNSGATLDQSALRRLIVQRLPSYMVPRQIIVVDELPRTASGKIDRLALAGRGGG